jgi:hypothetical protein
MNIVAAKDKILFIAVFISSLSLTKLARFAHESGSLRSRKWFASLTKVVRFAHESGSLSLTKVARFAHEIGSLSLTNSLLAHSPKGVQ